MKKVSKEINRMVKPFLILFVLDVVLFRFYDTWLSSCITNIISHSLLTSMSLFTFFAMDVSPDDFDIEDGWCVVCGNWLLWYLVYDLFRMILNIVPRDDIYVVHHLSAIVLMSVMLEYGMLHYYIPIICLFEASSVLLNVRYALLHTGRTDYLLYVEAAFVVVFVFVRLIFGFGNVLNGCLLLWRVEEKTVTEFFVMIVVFLSTIIFMALHAFWMIGIVRRYR